MNLKLFRAGGERYKLRFYVAHDGSMVRLAALLGFGRNGPLRWPALGSEIVMEVRAHLRRARRVLLPAAPLLSIPPGLADSGESAVCARHA